MKKYSSKFTFAEKKLYHQIHPLKLATDISTGLLTTFLAWQHNLILFVIFFLLPSVIASIAIIKFADLEKLRNSSLGKYIKKNMTSQIEAIRLFGQLVMWLAAYYHNIYLVILGFLIIVLAWLNGIFKFRR
jgi:hypothetical protein